MATLLLLVTSLIFTSAAVQPYHYYRSSNFDETLPLKTNVSSKLITSRTVIWNTTFRNFDSNQDVHVARFDIFFQNDTNISIPFSLRIGGTDGVLRLTNGPAYLFTTADRLTIEDTITSVTNSASTQDAVWLSGGSCVRIDISMDNNTISAGNNNMTVLVLSSGTIDYSLNDVNINVCNTSIIKIGTEDLHNNPVDYIPSGYCSHPLSGPGDAPDYDDLDAPIRPLKAHYHTRSAVYYTSRGVSYYNDSYDGYDESAMTEGELRFVTAGHFYGPETMWGNHDINDYYVLSLHEADPAKQSTKPSNPPNGFTPCPFACLDEPKQGNDMLRCVVNTTANN
eukprot:343619_1